MQSACGEASVYIYIWCNKEILYKSSHLKLNLMKKIFMKHNGTNGHFGCNFQLNLFYFPLVLLYPNSP